MPKICVHYVKVNGKDRPGEIHYTASCKEFHFKFPQEVTDWGKVVRPDVRHLAIAGSQKELETKIDEVVAEYEKSNLVERKVIAYKIECSSTRMDLRKELAEAEDEYDRDRARHYAAVRDEEVEIRLKMRILLERTVGTSKLLLEQEEEGDGTLSWRSCGYMHYDDWSFISWSPVSEKFFNEFYGGCEEMIRRMDAFAGTPEKVQKAITNSSRLLEAPKKRGKK